MSTINKDEYIELAREVKENKAREAKRKFIDEVINLLARGVKLYDLPSKYAFETAKLLINGSELSDDDKKFHREHFANAVIFAGYDIPNSRDWDAVMATRDSIVNKLEEN